MTGQLALSFERLESLGACAFGPGDLTWDGPHHCAECAAEVERAHQEFQAAVARGEYDAQGYTPAERNALRRRAA